MCVCAAIGAGSRKVRPVRDGFMLNGADGTLTSGDSNNVWFFEFESEVSYGDNKIKAGTAIEFLRSAALEKMRLFLSCDCLAS